MTNPYRAMCAELADVVYEYCILHEGRDHLQPLVDRARALLAQPEAEEPTDEELTLTYAYAVAAAVGNKRGQFTTEDIEAAQLAGLRAVLANWGHQ